MCMTKMCKAFQTIKNNEVDKCKYTLKMREIRFLNSDSELKSDEEFFFGPTKQKRAELAR